MPTTMSRQKGNPLTFERAQNEFVRRIAERSLDLDLVDLRQFRHLIKAAAANDSNFRLGHSTYFLSLQLCSATYCANAPVARFASKSSINAFLALGCSFTIDS